MIVVFYCYLINDWKERLTGQIHRLYKSGLYESVDQIYLYVADETAKLQQDVQELIVNFPKIQLDYSTKNYGEAVLALSKVDELARSGEYKILYFHTKGVFNKYKNFNTKEVFDLKLKGINCWTEMLEYFLIDGWKNCVSKLDSYDTVGVTNNGDWWWGNFWWTTSKHIRNNTPFKDYFNGSRWSCEAWLHEANQQRNKIKPYEMFHFEWDPYYTVIPKYLYDGSDLSNLKIDIVDAKFGYFAEQRDEGGSIGVVEDKIVDVTHIVKDWIKSDPSKISIRCDSVTFQCDPAYAMQKSTRIKFITNFDNKEYTITSFPYFSKIHIGNINKNE